MGLRSHCRPRSHEKRWCPARHAAVSVVVAVGLSVGCAHLTKVPPPTLTGTYKGNTSDGRPVSVTLDQDGNAVTGYGELDSRRMAVSAVTSWHGPVVLVFPDGKTSQGDLTLAAHGDKIALRAADLEAVMTRTVGAPAHSSGPFAGRFVRKGPLPMWVTLSQEGHLIGGTGYVNGRAVAVAGKTTGPDQVQGTLLFSDESRNAVKATLSDGGHLLTVEGLGESIRMRRQ